MRALLAVAAVSLALSSSAAAAAPTATQWKDRAYGYSIILPQRSPESLAELKAAENRA